MDPDLAHHLSDSQGLPSWAWGIAGGIVTLLLSALAWSFTALRGRDVALSYTRQEADDKFTTKEERASGCAAHLTHCREVHERVERAMEAHHNLPTHPGADRRIAVLEEAIAGLRRSFERIEKKIDDLPEKIMAEVDERMAKS